MDEESKSVEDYQVIQGIPENYGSVLETIVSKVKRCSGKSN